MDRSVDSIGSCSLDVDADSDVTDTSGSLNFPTPISIKDIPREFTTNIRERCSVRTLNPAPSMTIKNDEDMVLTQPKCNLTVSSALLTSATVTTSVANSASPEKKPSYLNLACCVNGYSNLTTYDSKVRQDINKSREVSPIRPSSSSIQYCKKNNSLAPPLLHSVPAEYKKSIHIEKKGKMSADSIGSPSQDDFRNTSFIQQRVERLYGPAALAQGFYSPKKVRSGSLAQGDTCGYKSADENVSELTRKFQQLTPSKDYGEFRKKLSATTSARQIVSSVEIGSVENHTVDLPVFRHLSQEFRAQLPKISPKRNIVSNCENKIAQDAESVNRNLSKLPAPSKTEVALDTVDHQQVAISRDNVLINGNKEREKVQAALLLEEVSTKQEQMEKDGNYFLALLKSEQVRLLNLADEAENYIDLLTNNGNASEDTLGFLRAASGKARLLVSQKMKQFEGLCHKNLNSSPDDKFPTTVDDLQGFWDMVYLQVDHIDSIFSEIKTMKENNWKMSVNAVPAPAIAKGLTKPYKTANQKVVRTSTSNVSKPQTNATSAAAAKREAQRKLLQDMKRKNRMAIASKSTTSGDGALEENTTNSNVVEIFVTDTNNVLSK